MTLAAGLLMLALLGQPQSRTYYWRDAQGENHLTNTPPPADAEMLDAPPPLAVEVKHPPQRLAQNAEKREEGNPPGGALGPAQKAAWDAVNQRLTQARAAGDTATLQTVVGSLIQNSLWGNGLWTLPLLPLLSISLLGLLGWWLALGLPSSARVPLVAGSLAAGLALGQFLLSWFLYRHQANRLHRNLEILEYYTGAGHPVRPEIRSLMQVRYEALERAARPLQPPWRFPFEVRMIRETMAQVMVDP